MKTKMILFTVIALFLLTVGIGCEKEKKYTLPSDPKLAILGKWVIEATGTTEDDMHPYDPYRVTNDYFEFLSDRTTWHYCATCVDKNYFQAGTYNIDSEYYYWYAKDTGIPDIYYYSFYDEKLKISKANPIIPEHEKINVENVIIYKRIK